jgi:hypothetical protein
MSSFAQLAALSLVGTAFIAAPAAAQAEAENNGSWGWEQLDSSAPKSWYVMIAVEQAVGPAGCDTFRYKVSSVEPIEITGPPEVRAAHGDEMAGWWMMFVKQRAPLAYRWLTTSVGHNPPEVYFRETAEEVMEAFRADGHLRNNRSCTGSRLVGLRTSKFEFNPPPGFAKSDFGNEPAPQGVTVSRDLKAIPGER